MTSQVVLLGGDDGSFEVTTSESDAGTWHEARDAEGRIVQRFQVERIEGPTLELPGDNLIWQVTVRQAGGFNFAATEATIWGTHLGIEDEFPPVEVILFENDDFTVEDVGTESYATAENEPNFEGAVHFLTNGIEDTFSRCLSLDHPGMFPTGGCIGSAESAWFGDAGTNGIDLEGFEITAFSLHVDAFEWESPGSDVNNDGDWTDYDFTVTLRILGPPINPVEVPTVSGLGMVALVLLLLTLGLVMLRRRAQVG